MGLAGTAPVNKSYSGACLASTGWLVFLPTNPPLHPPAHLVQQAVRAPTAPPPSTSACAALPPATPTQPASTPTPATSASATGACAWAEGGIGMHRLPVLFPLPLCTRAGSSTRVLQKQRDIECVHLSLKPTFPWHLIEQGLHRQRPHLHPQRRGSGAAGGPVLPRAQGAVLRCGPGR